MTSRKARAAWARPAHRSAAPDTPIPIGLLESTTPTAAYLRIDGRNHRVAVAADGAAIGGAPAALLAGRTSVAAEVWLVSPDRHSILAGVVVVRSAPLLCRADVSSAADERRLVLEIDRLDAFPGPIVVVAGDRSLGEAMRLGGNRAELIPWVDQARFVAVEIGGRASSRSNVMSIGQAGERGHQGIRRWATTPSD
jgi:hypothetical protein